MIVIGIDPSLSSCGVSDGGEHHELVKTLPGPEDVDMINDLDRRCDEIVDNVAQFINRHHSDAGEISICIEAPMLSAHGSGAHFLFEAGWLYHAIYCYLGGRIEPEISRIVRVPTSTLRKWAVGKGNVRKDDMKLKVFRKFGIEFENDPGADKLFAFLLARYGAAVAAGEVDFTNSKRRGSGAHAKAAVRRAQRAKGAA